MEREVDTGILNRRFGKRHQIRMLCILSRTGGYLKNHWGFLLGSRLRNRLNDLHVVYVESADGISALICFLEHFGSGYNAHFLSSFPQIRRIPAKSAFIANIFIFYIKGRAFATYILEFSETYGKFFIFLKKDFTFREPYDKINIVCIRSLGLRIKALPMSIFTRRSLGKRTAKKFMR